MTDGAEQGVLVERLPEMPGSGRFEARERRRIVMGGDEQHWNGEPLLELEPADAVEMHVEDEARRMRVGQPGEEFAGGGERLGGVPGCAEDARQ